MKIDESIRTIWSNDFETIEALEQDIRETPEDFCCNYDNDDDVWALACEVNDDFLEDEKANLNKPLGNTLVMIGTLGLWYGTRHGWKLLEGNNLNDVFQGTCGDYVTWYIDKNGDICCKDVHHDGTNYYKYRIIKDGISDWEFEELMAEGKNIDDLTEKLGNHVADIYGFEKTWEVK